MVQRRYIRKGAKPPHSRVTGPWCGARRGAAGSGSRHAERGRTGRRSCGETALPGRVAAARVGRCPSRRIPLIPLNPHFSPRSRPASRPGVRSARSGSKSVSGNTVEARIVRSARVDARHGRAPGRDPKGGALRPTACVTAFARCPRIALHAVPTLSGGQRRADHEPGEKCGLNPVDPGESHPRNELVVSRGRALGREGGCYPSGHRGEAGGLHAGPLLPTALPYLALSRRIPHYLAWILGIPHPPPRRPAQSFCPWAARMRPDGCGNGPRCRMCRQGRRVLSGSRVCDRVQRWLRARSRRSRPEHPHD